MSYDDTHILLVTPLSNDRRMAGSTGLCACTTTTAAVACMLARWGTQLKPAKTKTSCSAHSGRSRNIVRALRASNDWQPQTSQQGKRTLWARMHASPTHGCTHTRTCVCTREHVRAHARAHVCTHARTLSRSPLLPSSPACLLLHTHQHMRACLCTCIPTQ